MGEVTCRYCGELVYVSPVSEPVSFREDPADEFGPAQFVIVGAGRLLHRCEIPEAEP